MLTANCHAQLHRAARAATARSGKIGGIVYAICKQFLAI
jgi:hypothetical protein